MLLLSLTSATSSPFSIFRYNGGHLQWLNAVYSFYLLRVWKACFFPLRLASIEPQRVAALPSEHFQFLLFFFLCLSPTANNRDGTHVVSCACDWVLELFITFNVHTSTVHEGQQEREPAVMQLKLQLKIIVHNPNIFRLNHRMSRQSSKSSISYQNSYA